MAVKLIILLQGGFCHPNNLSLSAYFASMRPKASNSFERDANKLPESILAELKLIYTAIEAAQSLDDLTYSVKKMEGSRKLKAFQLRLSEHSDFRIGFYLEGDTVVLSRILNRKEIYKKFPPNR